MISLAWFFVIFLVLLALVALLLYRIGDWIKDQANKPEKRFFAPIPRPGTFSFVVLEGKVKRTLEGVVGWTLKEQENLGKAMCFEPKKETEESKEILEKYLGVVWIGFYETIQNFPDWKWSEFKQIESGEDGKKEPAFQVVAREAKAGKPVSDFFFQYNYPVILDDAEIQGNYKVRIVAIMVVLHLHPVRAFFLNKDPVALFNAMVQSMLRSYVADMEFNNIKQIKPGTNTEKGKNPFWDAISELNGIELDDTGRPKYEESKANGLFGKLGDMIVRGEIVQVEAVGEAAKALEAQQIADLKGKALVTEQTKKGEAELALATKRAEAINAETEAIARRIEETIVKPTGGAGPHVARVLTAQEISGEKSKITTWVEGNSGIVIDPNKKSS